MSVMTRDQKQFLLDYVVGDHKLSAVIGMDEDRKLQELEKLGMVQCYDSSKGRHYYQLTSAAYKELHE